MSRTEQDSDIGPIPSTESPPEITRGKEIDLTGQVAIVTGSSRGVGRAIAIKLGFHGAQVVLNSTEHSAEQAEEVLLWLRKFGTDGLWVPGDISQQETANKIAQQTIDRYGQVDILVNNAGITRDGLILGMKPENWQDVIDTNLSGVFYMTQAVYRPMMRKRSGSIINISSVSGQVGNPGQANYAAAKAGLEALTKTTALELASRGVRVNAVALGLVDTDMTSGLKEEQRQHILDLTPMRRPITVEEAAEAVLFLASDRASGITGQVFNVDGGMVRK